MGLLTFSEMQSQVRSMLGGRTDQDALIMRGLQFSQHRIAKKFEPPELRITDTTTVTNTGTGNEETDATITMPDTLRKLHSLSIVDTSKVTKLERVGSDKWEEIIGSVSQYGTGQPRKYTLYSKSVLLYPVPDGTYTVRRFYSNWPTEIVLNTAKTAPSTTTATSDLDHKDEMIIMYAVVWCYLALGNQDKANYYFSVFRDMLSGSETFDIIEPDLGQSSSMNRTTYPDHTVPRFGG